MGGSSGKVEYKKQIIKTIESMSGRYAPYNIFSDWVMLCALSIQNTIDPVQGKVWKEREQLYSDTAKKYTSDELNKFSLMFVWLTNALEEKMSDVLGEIFMEAGLGSKYMGQFFTPFHASLLCARLSINLDNLPETEKITLNEPSCGGGGMIIAACKVLLDAGINYQQRLDVVAQDLDWKGVYMTYLQLSLIGCRARVVQGDTLKEPFVENKTDPGHIMKTPAYMGLLI